jgi:excisionase family DNA binding protein
MTLLFREGAMKFLKLKSVAELLDCSLSNVYSLVAQGKLPVHRVGLKKGLRVAEEDLLAYLKQVRSEAAEQSAVAPPIKPRPKLNLKHLDLRQSLTPSEKG